MLSVPLQLAKRQYHCCVGKSIWKLEACVSSSVERIFSKIFFAIFLYFFKAFFEHLCFEDIACPKSEIFLDGLYAHVSDNHETW